MPPLYLAFLIILVAAIAELVGAVFSHSSSLLSDFVHMATDLAGLGVAIVVQHRARRKETQHSKEYTEARGAHLNMMILACVGVGVMVNGAWHLFYPPDIQFPLVMLVVAVVGLAANIIVLFVLHEGTKDSRNVTAAFAHVLADTGTSIVVILVAAVIVQWGITILDPIASVVIGAIIFLLAFKRTTHLHEDIQILEEQMASP